MEKTTSRILRSQQLTVICIALFCFFWTTANVSNKSLNKVLGWGELIEAIRDEPSFQKEIDWLVRQAREEVNKGLVRRAYRLEDIGLHRTWLDGRSEALEDEIRETFALAMSDFAACNTLSRMLPMVAAAAKITNDTLLREHVIAQLEEMSGWQPLQRPGWTLYKPGNRLPSDGKDGNWLATGTGVRAIITTLEIMGDDISDTLKTSLADLLEKEITGVVEDWEFKRPWFVRSNNAITNQWVLPTEGLVRACLYLGIDKHKEAYELGVKNLLQALSVHGKAGEFEEGIGYAAFTLTSMLHTARAMAVLNDRRAIEHPFLIHFPTWAVHHIQPGRMSVNCFDAGNAQISKENMVWRSLFSLLVFGTGSEVANWALQNQFDGPSEDLAGLACRVLSREISQTPPKSFAAYDRAAMVVWRDNWGNDATGVWIRGGHELDQHDHQDRGHVNFIAQGKPILIEAGTPSYSNPDMGVHYASGAGHNVLQIGTFFPERPYPAQTTPRYTGWQQPGCVSSITVHQLNEQRGKVHVECSDCYTETRQWLREVDWTAQELCIRDIVSLKESNEIILFRYHLGTNETIRIKNADHRYEVQWSDAVINILGSVPLELSQYKAPDSTITAKEDFMHTCLEIRTKQAISEVNIEVTVTPIHTK